MGVATVFSCAVAVTAQTQQTGQAQQTQTQRQETTTPSQPQGRATTSMFIGCVEKGSTPNAFVLSVVEVPKTATAAGPAPAGSGQANAQATGTTGTVMVGHKVDLVGGTNIASHLGHKVEISGMLVPQGSPAGRAGQTPAANSRVNVTNVRMIDATCTPAPATRGTAGTSEPAAAPETQKTQPEPQGAPGQRPY
jgi:hypothetical protein